MTTLNKALTRRAAIMGIPLVPFVLVSGANMLLNLPDFVSFIFTTKTLPSASLISPIKVQKRVLETFTISPDIAASAAPVKRARDFGEEENVPQNDF
ncbi:VirB3 family type IV secretion system protein [Dickeya zeae]|uniref:VirB3 family type IV secretion system protein n=1 Tax=Dickeya zeae TaxID=204042 RepID=UPI000C9A44F9|nr:hypothetical protein C1O30_07555 [Dickeya zeae]UJR58024.1 VirB3 family type IV secretion system protein [Dickeya zeae]